MKKLLFFPSIMLILAFSMAFASCGMIKQSVSTSTEIYIGAQNGQAVKYEDKNGYLTHLIQMGITTFQAEHLGGVTFAPIREFNFSDGSTSLEPGKTKTGPTVITVRLLDEEGNVLIKPYTRRIY